ncbi:hypothetical protein ACTOB_004102 [Actinoplanes oblitus]|uniref:Uncharacterized protein n=1 Tax=Actinoplanes oblitus TaxID=3040509 RepID=A0ABY8WSF7_9ACTN|nr:hypothetical protein [Actinoplanes oblitus]WIN00398.1 hypothetical protein ACTOB_004102 [Actinoplanes oblitus]
MSTAALRRAFDRLRASRAADADTAEHALTDALRPLAGSVWPEVAWRSSRLTGTGYPVELAWASRDAAVRWTCEVAGPETPEADRLRLARRVAGSAVDAGPWLLAQREHRLLWGAWLGWRQLDGVRHRKIYLELPDGRVPAGPWSAAAAELDSRVGGLTWRMAGLNDDGSVELYARALDPTWTALTSAAALVGDGSRLVGLVGGLVGYPWPCGLSLVLAPAGTPVALTCFAIAKTVWACDAAARAAVLRTTDTVDHPAASRQLYAALSAGPDDGRWRHGMVGAGVDSTGRAWLQAGLRPT